MSVLRRDLLQDVRVALAGPPPAIIRQRLADLGAAVEIVQEAQAPRPPPHMLLFDARPAFGGGGSDRLRESLEAAWFSIHAIANAALIPSPAPSKISMIAPAASAGLHAVAARAGLENLARTLSVEWARHGITVTALHPGESTTDEQLAELVSFIASPAGNYLSGCRLELGAVQLG